MYENPNNKPEAELCEPLEDYEVTVLVTVVSHLETPHVARYVLKYRCGDDFENHMDGLLRADNKVTAE